MTRARLALAAGALSAVAALAAPLRSARADSVGALQAAWQAGKYADVLPRLVTYWKGPGGRTWQVGYMIGTARCRVGLASRGVGMLEDLLETFALPTEVRDAVRTEIEVCRAPVAGAGHEPAPPASPDASVMLVAAAAGVSGKGGYLLWDNGSQISAELHTTPIPVAELCQCLVFVV